MLKFLIGLGIGAGVGLLVAPCSGEDARQWLRDSTGQNVKRLRRQGRRWLFEAQDALDKSQDTVSKVFKNSKNALDEVAARL